MEVDVLQQTINGISLGASYALLGLGVALIWGVLRVLNFAFGQFITWGAFACFYCLQAGVPTWLSMVIGMIVGGLLAVVVDSTVLAYMRHKRSSEFAMVVATIGVSYLLMSIVQSYTDSQIEAFPAEKFPRGSVSIGSLEIPELVLMSLAIGIFMMAVLGIWLQYTKSGRATRTVSWSEDTAALLGVRSSTIFALSVFISGALAAVAGICISAATATLSYSTGDPLLVIAFAVIVIGGMGSVYGAMIGGLLLGLAQVYTTAYIANEFSEAVGYIAIILILVVRPSGLFGQSEEQRV
ncbi:branched-chain amino acid ABC transporter permease [Williamsia sp. 1138]|uniref:branched-chain amino acid ABC transporter permease n=1 Tax=Williamsia sp. 1138 TaxID=1903117 RepID=UPI00143DD95F|nr:branched-chain amino acid ABC transporter permease [Williamsia sp. 1138]